MEDDLQLANPERRIGAYLLDSVIAVIAASPFFLGMQLTGAFSDDKLDIGVYFAWFIPAMLVVYGGIVYLEGEKGATPGKWLLGIRVRDVESDQVIGWRRALGRRLMFYVDAIPLYLGFWWMFFDARYQCWHDKAAHSLVVRGRSAG
jgi:uncharacterized RDD family membrane protein YckC